MKIENDELILDNRTFILIFPYREWLFSKLIKMFEKHFKFSLKNFYVNNNHQFRDA